MNTQPETPYVIDELTALLGTVMDIIEDGMNLWSDEVQPQPKLTNPHDLRMQWSDGWYVGGDEDLPLDWTPTATVRTHRADLRAVRAIAGPLEQMLRQEANTLIAQAAAIGLDKNWLDRLSNNAEVLIRIDVLDAPLTIDKSGAWARMPSTGATFGADARLVLSERLTDVLRFHGINVPRP